MSTGQRVPILMFHSIANGPGPVSIPPGTFRDQLQVLADTGARGISVSEYVSAREAGTDLAPGTVVLTFDDGYRDFAEAAFPDLAARGWRCTVFVPIHPIDADRPWDCGDGHPRAMLTWPAIRELAREGVEFGAHSLSHRNLTRLSAESAADEIGESGRRLAERIERNVDGFAPPFGSSSRSLRGELTRHYRWSVGVRQDRAGPASNLFDLPRIEMWYFRDIRRWRDYLSKGWTAYFEMRRTLRALRRIV